MRKVVQIGFGALKHKQRHQLQVNRKPLAFDLGDGIYLTYNY